MTPTLDAGAENVTVKCARCHSDNVALVVRTEHLCRDCFLKYVNMKVLKRLETHKIRGTFHEEPKTVLLPISFGISSVALLHVLDQLLQNRTDQRRHAGFKIHVLHVFDANLEHSEKYKKLWEHLQHRFPAHTYSWLSFEDYHKYAIDLSALNNSTSTQFNLEKSELPRISLSSRTDLMERSRISLVNAFAQKHRCDSILLGDTTTRLAERTLSETAHGRGGEIPLVILDGLADGTKCIFPCRDLLRIELSAYSEMVEPALNPLIIKGTAKSAASSKDKSINSLMTQFFESVEDNYPSIVANVVRTAGKLQPMSD